MILKTDCRHFPGDRPCLYNKKFGMKCDNCDHYSPVREKIVIIKLDAVGDVLRTTCILHAIKDQYPNSSICWLTKSSALVLFLQNSFVEEILFLEQPDLGARMQTEVFDLMINPDASSTSAALASIIQAKKKKGFGLDKRGKVFPFNEEAVPWLEMGAFDEYKKQNAKTYQQIIHELSGFQYKKDEIILNLSEQEQEFKNRFLLKHKIPTQSILIGLNTGASSRWQLKQWRLEGYTDLIRLLLKEPDVKIMLYGGPDEKERNTNLMRLFPKRIINTGTSNSLRHFFALLDLSHIIVTGDTLALHAATALKKEIVCVFGPTSSAEIEDYGRITKIMPKMDCLCCYKPICDFNPNCMDLITIEMVYGAVLDKIVRVRALQNRK